MREIPWSNEYEIKEGELAKFKCDGDFIVYTRNRVTYVKTDTGCFFREEPRFTHDCPDCSFLGNLTSEEKEYVVFDAYHCMQGGFPTVIARYGDQPENYTSGKGMPNLDLKLIERLFSKEITFIEQSNQEE